MLKRIVLKYFPEGVLLWLKKIHYHRFLKSLLIDREQDLKIVKYFVKAGDVVVDIGANIGVYTMFLSYLTGTEGMVFSFEPIPFTCQILKSNVEKLHLDNVRVFQRAVSDQGKEVTMEVPLYESGGENFYESHIVEEGEEASGRVFSVKSTTLDAFLDSSQQISFIKCDTEGNDLNVLIGAGKVIEKNHPVWLIEISSDPDMENSQAYKIFELLNKFGYLPYLFDNNILRIRKHGDVSVNYFFLTQIHINNIRNNQAFLNEYRLIPS